MTYKEQFIEFLVISEALRFGEFTTKSGRLSPYFINAGMFRTGSHIEKLGGFYADCIMETVGGNFDVMFGPAYKGIPLAVSAATSLYRKYNIDKEYCFNRKEAKTHGEGGIFVGKTLADGDRVIYIEDVITSGAAVRETMPFLLAAASVSVKDMYIMVDRLEVGINGKTAPQEIFDEFGITVHPIVNSREIIDYLHNRPINGKIVLNDERLATMKIYMEKYCLK